MANRERIGLNPLRLIPEPVERIWGGDAVQQAFGWRRPKNATIGEWWLVSFRPDHPSRIGQGSFEGRLLYELVQEFPELLGEGNPPSLLIKILDSADRLSVQVHPDDELAAALRLESGKTECWYFLDSPSHARIYYGLRKGVAVDRFFDLAKRNPSPEEMEKLLRPLPAQKGETAFIPAGTIHAIGKEVLLLEVQQNSDTTFRIYDWGRPREVHLEEAERAVKEARPQESIMKGSPGENSLLASCDAFTMRLLRIEGEGSISGPGEIYGAATCLEGEGMLAWGDASAPFLKGDTFFLPARCPDLEVRSRGAGEWMISIQGGQGRP